MSPRSLQVDYDRMVRNITRVDDIDHIEYIIGDDGYIKQFRLKSNCKTLPPVPEGVFHGVKKEIIIHGCRFGWYYGKYEFPFIYNMSFILECPFDKSNDLHKFPLLE